MSTKTEKDDFRRKQRQRVLPILVFPIRTRAARDPHLTLLIYRLIKSRGFKKVQAGEILGIKQAPTFR
jgi:hypothetical protein